MVTPKNASGHEEVSIMASTTVRMKTITSTTKLQTTLDVRLLLYWQKIGLEKTLPNGCELIYLFPSHRMLAQLKMRLGIWAVRPT